MPRNPSLPKAEELEGAFRRHLINVLDEVAAGHRVLVIPLIVAGKKGPGPSILDIERITCNDACVRAVLCTVLGFDKVLIEC